MIPASRKQRKAVKYLRQYMGYPEIDLDMLDAHEDGVFKNSGLKNWRYLTA